MSYELHVQLFIFLIHVCSDDGSTTKDIPVVLSVCNEEYFKLGTRDFHPTEDADSSFIKPDMMSSDDLHPTYAYVTRKVRSMSYIIAS